MQKLNYVPGLMNCFNLSICRDWPPSPFPHTKSTPTFKVLGVFIQKSWQPKSWKWKQYPISGLFFNWCQKMCLWPLGWLYEHDPGYGIYVGRLANRWGAREIVGRKVSRRSSKWFGVCGWVDEKEGVSGWDATASGPIRLHRTYNGPWWSAM